MTDPGRTDRTPAPDGATRTDGAPRSDGIPGGAPRAAVTRVIAMMNQKGGVGKTTTTVNLADGIARLGRRVLLIDLDPQAHATLHLGVDTDEIDTSVYDVLLERDDSGALVRESVVRTRENLHVLPAATDLAAAETELASEGDRALRLAEAVAHVRAEYDVILIDCPPSLGTLTLNGLACAREVIVPMQAHFLALQGVGKLLETVSLVGRSVNPGLRVSGVVLTMHEEQSRHAREVVQDIVGFFKSSAERDVPWRGARVYQPAVRRNIKLAESPSFGQTIFEYAPSCNGAEDYRALAGRLVEEWDRLLERVTAQRTTEPATRRASAGTPAEGETVS